MTTRLIPRDVPALALTFAALATAAWAVAAGPETAAVRALLLPLTMLALLANLRQIANRRRRRFWNLWAGAIASWWLIALLSLTTGLRDSRAQALELLGYLLILVSVAARPRARVAEGQQSSVHRLRLSALLTTFFSLVAYTYLLGEAEAARTVARGVLPLLDLCGATLLLRLASQLRGALRQTCGLLGGGLAVLALLHFGDAVWADGLNHSTSWWALGSWRPAAEVLPFLLFGLAGRLRKRNQKIPDTAQTRLFPIPSAFWIGALPLVHLTLDLGPVGSADVRWLVIVSALVSTALALAEHRALNRRNLRLEMEHEKAERQTETRSVYLQSLIEHNPLAVVVLDADHTVRLCNPAFERIFGYSSEEMLGSSLDLVISTGKTRRQASIYTERVLSGETVYAQAVRQHKDGTEVYVDLWGVPLMEQGELIGIFAIYQDITDRVRSEQALRESEDRFRRLADATFEGIVVSEDGVIFDCNEQYARMMGGRVSDIIGSHVLDFVVPSDRPRVQQRLNTHAEAAYEHRALTLGGKERRVEIHGRSLNQEGRSMRVSAVRDVTAHRRLEEELRQAQKMEAVGRLAGGIAHDFNNVLTVIKGYAQLLGFQLEDSPLRGQVEEIHSAAERASLMTQRLLAFGRKQALQPQKLDLNQELKGMEKMLRTLIRADIELQLELDDDLGAIRADAGQLEQVVLNLAINASDAMPDGGLLRLRTANRVFDLDDTATPHVAPGSYVEMEVRDTGHGMDDTTRRQVFEPFFTTKEKGKGTGLGLATVYAIVQQNGGLIDVDSEVGRGTRFSILLPRVVDPALDEAKDVTLLELPGGAETVLVVEDEPGVRALAREFLESYGYQVIEAEDGKKALALFQDDGQNDDGHSDHGGHRAPDIDLVLTDVVMPGMNGPEMVRRLRQDRPGLEVLFMSGYTDEILSPEDLPEDWRLVHKPFSLEELLHKVRAVLDHTQPVV